MRRPPAGAYPFASSYMGGTDEHPLPPWPMREACAHLTRDEAWLAARGAAGPRGADRGGGGAAAAAHTAAAAARRRLGARGAGGGGAGGGARGHGDEEGEEWLLEGLRSAAGVLYNATGDKACFDLALEGPAAGSSGESRGANAWRRAVGAGLGPG
jgi:hypothetical protein